MRGFCCVNQACCSLLHSFTPSLTHTSFCSSCALCINDRSQRAVRGHGARRRATSPTLRPARAKQPRLRLPSSPLRGQPCSKRRTMTFIMTSRTTSTLMMFPRGSQTAAAAEAPFTSTAVVSFHVFLFCFSVFGGVLLLLFSSFLFVSFLPSLVSPSAMMLVPFLNVPPTTFLFVDCVVSFLSFSLFLLVFTLRR